MNASHKAVQHLFPGGKSLPKARSVGYPPPYSKHQGRDAVLAEHPLWWDWGSRSRNCSCPWQPISLMGCFTLAGNPFRSRICQGKHSVVLRSGSAAGVRFGRAVARQASSLWNSVEPFASGSMRPGTGCRLKQGRQCSCRVLVALSRKTRGWRGSTARWRTPSLRYRGAEPLCRPWSIRPHTSQTDFRTGLLQVSTTGIGVAALTGLGWTRIPMPPAISTLGCTATGLRCGCPAAR